MSAICAQGQLVEFTVPNSCNGAGETVGCLKVNTNYGLVVESSIVVSGSLGAEYTELILFGGNQKIMFEMDLTSGGEVIVDFETTNPVGTHQFSVQYEAFESVVWSEIDIVLTPDCGIGNGGIEVVLEGDELVEITYFVLGSNGVENIGNGLSIEDLGEGQYIISGSDLYCAQNSTFIFVTVPDGSFTIDVTTIEPLLNCVNSVSEEDASGVIPATIEGTIDGGSGEFDVLIDFGSAVSSSEEFDFSIESVTSTGSYTIDVIDLESGCASFIGVIVTDDDLVFETTEVLTVPIVTNGLGDYYEFDGLGAISVSTNLDASHDLEYDWSPGPGSNGNDGTYIDIEVPTIYTMIASVENTTCELEIVVDMEDHICIVPVDLNGDGIVNAVDFSEFLWYFGTFCTSDPCPGDFNFDGIVNVVDLQILMNTTGMDVVQMASYFCE